MAPTSAPLELVDVGLGEVDIRIRFPGPGESESTYQPSSVRLRPGGLFVNWPEAPHDLRTVELEWEDCPFTPQAFRCRCTVAEHTAEGLHLTLDGPVPATLKEWFERLSWMAARREPDSALKTSKLYTSATVVSAGGLFCGALAILLPILGSGQWWIDLLSKFLLLVMVCSIAGFAWIRFLAGRAEVQAIRQSPS